MCAGAYEAGSERCFMKKKDIVLIIVFVLIVAALIVGICLTDGLYTSDEDISDAMQDAVLHEEGQVSLFGLAVNPALISSITVTLILLVFALVVRVFAIPRFKNVPGKFQLFIESVVGWFDGTARSNSPHRNSFLGAYIFAAGVYIFVGTLFELIGIQVETVHGTSPKGILRPLKDFSLPISMSFRLFGALLSGLLVTELVYYYLALSFVLPVIVGVLFTLLHAVIQTIVLVTLTSMFYGEAAEPFKKRKHKEKHKQDSDAVAVHEV